MHVVDPFHSEIEKTMQDLFAFLNEPIILWTLLLSGVALFLIDYFFPVDWPAFVGYLAVSIFFGATAPVGQTTSLLVMVCVFVGLLVLHMLVLTHFLTNAPKYERLDKPDGDDDQASGKTVEPS